MSNLPITLSNASGVPFYRQVVDQITRMIQSGSLKPGDQLPSVRELAAQLLVSLITIRRAYSDLEVAGMIIRRQGYGTYVQENIEAPIQKHIEKEVRLILEGAIAQVKQLGATNSEIQNIVSSHLGEGDQQ